MYVQYNSVLCISTLFHLHTLSLWGKPNVHAVLGNKSGHARTIRPDCRDLALTCRPNGTLARSLSASSGAPPTPKSNKSLRFASSLVPSSGPSITTSWFLLAPFQSACFRLPACVGQRYCGAVIGSSGMHLLGASWDGAT